MLAKPASISLQTCRTIPSVGERTGSCPVLTPYADFWLMIAAAGPVLDLPEHLVEVERGRFLTRREPHESLDLLRDEALHTVEQIGVGDHPVPVGVRVFVRPLERVAAQVEHLRRSEFYERLEPAHQLLGPLLHEHHFP